MIRKAFKTKKQRKRQLELLLTVFLDSFLIDLFLHLFGIVAFKLDKIDEIGNRARARRC